jgi:hypothetical protein
MFVEEWLEYAEIKAEEAYYDALASLGLCLSCKGEGDHGFEEESGLPYVCHRCGGTGAYHP